MGLLALKPGLRFKVFEREFQGRACNSGQAIAHGISFCEYQPFCGCMAFHLLCIFSSLQGCFQLQTWSVRVWGKKFSLDELE